MKKSNFLSSILLLITFNGFFIFVYIFLLTIAVPSSSLPSSASLRPSDLSSFSSSPLALSVLGRFGQNAEINGEYRLISKSNEMVLYKKKDSTNDLYIFKLQHENTNLWAIGELPHRNEEIRAFVEAKDSLMSPVEVDGVWKVFEENPLTLQLHILPDKFIRIKEVSCKNHAKDGNEEGVDCGGDCITRCKEMKSCILPKVPPTTYTYGTCFNKETLMHGEQCEYVCPIGFLTRGAVGRTCYDGVLLQVKRGLSCVTGFTSRPCPYIELIGDKNILGECEGKYVNSTLLLTPSLSSSTAFSTLSLMTNQQSLSNNNNTIIDDSNRSYIWYKENSDNEKIFLYWRNGEWICADFQRRMNKGFISDNQPYRFTGDGNYKNLKDVESEWLTKRGEEKFTKVTLRCYIPDVLVCSTIYITAKNSDSFGEIVDGTWSQIQQNSPGGRPQYIHSSGIRIYWLSNGYWIFDVDDNPTEFVAFIFSLEFLPPSGIWTRWSKEEKNWQKVDLKIKCINQMEEQLSSYYEDKVSDGDDAIRLGASENRRTSAVRIKLATESKLNGLLQSIIQHSTDDFKIKPALQNLYEGSPCIHLKVKGAIGKGTDCNGVFTRVVSSDRDDVFWYKLLSDSTLLYFYWTGGKWICTANDGAAKGYIEDSRGNVPTQLLQKNAATKKVVGKGFWITNAGYDFNVNSTVECYNPNSSIYFNSNKCGSLIVSQFTGTAEIFNGLWKFSELQINGRFHYVKKIQDNSTVLHLYYNRQGLWIISLSVDRLATESFPYLAYMYSVNELPSSGIWTVFDSSKNKAVMHSVYIECQVIPDLNDDEYQFSRYDNNYNDYNSRNNYSSNNQNESTNGVTGDRQNEHKNIDIGNKKTLKY